LLVTPICAVASLVVSQGLRGKPWGSGVSMGLLAVRGDVGALGAWHSSVLCFSRRCVGRIGARRQEISGRSAKRMRGD